jgi:hypothetical protein
VSVIGRTEVIPPRLELTIPPVILGPSFMRGRWRNAWNTSKMRSKEGPLS